MVNAMKACIFKNTIRRTTIAMPTAATISTWMSWLLNVVLAALAIGIALLTVASMCMVPSLFRSVAQAELVQDALCNHAGCRTDIHPDLRLIRGGFLEVGELTIKQARRHEVTVACGKPCGYGLP